jgi:hypothetical protein
VTVVGRYMQPSNALPLTGMRDTAVPRFKCDIARLARDIEIAGRRLESHLQQELHAGGLDADVVNWWTGLSPRLRTATVITIVWIFVLARLVTWSAEYPDVSDIHSRPHWYYSSRRSYCGLMGSTRRVQVVVQQLSDVAPQRRRLQRGWEAQRLKRFTYNYERREREARVIYGRPLACRR